MGVTIKCKKTGRNIDLGCSGFMRLRKKVAELMGGPFYSHYKKLYDAPSLMRPDEEKKFYTQWDTEAIRLITENNIPVKVVNFLLESDCDGKIRYGACKEILAQSCTLSVSTTTSATAMPAGATAQCSETSRQSCRTAWTTNVIWSGCRRMENGCCCVFQSICENVRFF